MIRRLLLAAALGGAAGPGAAQVCLCPDCMFGPLDRYGSPGASMAPFALPGDCMIFDGSDRAPELGEVVLQDTPTGPFIRRVVARAGQTVRMAGGRLLIDGRDVTTGDLPPWSPPPGARPPNFPCPGDDGSCALPRRAETVGGVTYEVLDTLARGPFDDTAEITVPPGHVFLLGDHRDNSMDNRAQPNVPGGGPTPLPAILGTYVRHQQTVPAPAE